MALPYMERGHVAGYHACANGVHMVPRKQAAKWKEGKENSHPMARPPVASGSHTYTKSNMAWPE